MNADDRAWVEVMLTANDVDGLAALLPALHRKYHDRPIDHVRVHWLWARAQLASKQYLRALGNVLAGVFAAVPSSLLQRYAGLVAPSFDASRIKSGDAK